MYVDWEYYKIFYYVAKYQNFTKAARVLGNNQPNITHSMNRLESQLNCVLFIRSNRGVTLTPEGEMLYSRIASAAVQIQDAEEELSASATLEHGAISISATEISTACPFWSTHIISFTSLFMLRKWLVHFRNTNNTLL